MPPQFSEVDLTSHTLTEHKVSFPVKAAAHICLIPQSFSIPNAVTILGADTCRYISEKVLPKADHTIDVSKTVQKTFTVHYSKTYQMPVPLTSFVHSLNTKEVEGETIETKEVTLYPSKPKKYIKMTTK